MIKLEVHVHEQERNHPETVTAWTEAMYRISLRRKILTVSTSHESPIGRWGERDVGKGSMKNVCNVRASVKGISCTERERERALKETEHKRGMSHFHREAI